MVGARPVLCPSSCEENMSCQVRQVDPMRARWEVATPGGSTVAAVDIEDWESADHADLPEAVERAIGCYPLANQVTWSYFKKTGTQWSREARARNRKRRLRERLERRCPMFADEFYERELSERAAYFEARHPVYDAGRPGGPPVSPED